MDISKPKGINVHGSYKSLVVFLVFFGVLFFTNCKTVPSKLSGKGNGAGEVRDTLAGVSSRQTDLAISGTKIEITSGNLETGIIELEQAIDSGEESNGDFEDIIRAIRKRPIKTN